MISFILMVFALYSIYKAFGLAGTLVWLVLVAIGAIIAYYAKIDLHFGSRPSDRFSLDGGSDKGCGAGKHGGYTIDEMVEMDMILDDDW